MKLFFEPSDFLFFRDGKPFSGGEVSFGSSMELPLPSVVYGAIRTRLLQDAQVDFTRFAKYKSSEEGAKDYPIIQLTGTSNTPGSLYIGGPYFASLRKDGKKLKEIFFPVPLDVVKQHSKDKRYNLLEPDFESSGQTNFPLPDLAPLRPKPRLELKSKMEEATGFLNLERMQNYLDGSSPVEVSSKNFVQSEQRIGIAIGSNYVTKSQMFYLLEGKRFANSLEESYGLVIDLPNVSEANTTLTESFFHLGGERRFGRIVPIESKTVPDAPEPETLSPYFKLVLATPAIFKKGWLPSWLDSQSGEGNLPTKGEGNLRVKLVAAAVGRGITLSGFDMAKRQPKPTRRAVPAGSVYYFELLEGQPEKLIELVHNSSISDEEAQAGFGIAFVGCR